MLSFGDREQARSFGDFAAVSSDRCIATMFLNPKPCEAALKEDALMAQVVSGLQATGFAKFAGCFVLCGLLCYACSRV